MSILGAPRRHHSLFVLLLAYAAVLVIPPLLFFAYLSWRLGEDGRDQTARDAANIAVSLARVADAEFGGFVQMAELSAASPRAQVGDWPAFERELVSLASVTEFGAGVVDEQGHLLAGDLSPVARQAVAAHETRSSPWISDLIAPDAGQYARFLVAVPVDGQPGKMLALAIPASRVSHLIHPPGLDNRWTLALVDRTPRVVARNRRADEFVGRLATEDFAAALRAGGSSGGWLGGTLEGTQVLGRFSTATTSGWYVAVGVELSQLDEPLRRALAQTSGLAIFLAGISLALAWLFGWRMVRALGLLRRSARLMEAGDIAPALDTPVTEVNQVGQQLSDVSHLLRARAQELQASEARLARILDTTPAAIIETDLDGGVTYANSAAEAVLRLPKEDIFSRSREARLWWRMTIDGEMVGERDTPVVRALAGEPIFDREAAIIDGAGRRVFISMTAVPVRDAQERITGCLVVLVDNTQRHIAEAATHESRARLRAVFETVPVGIVFADAITTDIVDSNPAAEQILGHPIPTGPGESAKFDWMAFTRDGRKMARRDFPLTRAMAGEEGAELECLYRRGDGSDAWIRIIGEPISNEAGQTIGAVAAIIDIDQLKRAEDHERFMNRELHHRVKNTLATVQAIANLTVRSAKDLDAFRSTFSERIISLSRTHTLLVENSWKEIPLRELITLELEPYIDQAHAQVSITGETIRLKSDMALALGIALHELTTNAVKHGALSLPRGTVEIEWTVEDAADRPLLVLTWTERNGPPVPRERRTGFGTKILRDVLARQLNGEVFVDYRPQGLVVTVKAPLQ